MTLGGMHAARVIQSARQRGSNQIGTASGLLPVDCARSTPPGQIVSGEVRSRDSSLRDPLPKAELEGRGNPIDNPAAMNSCMNLGEPPRTMPMAALCQVRREGEAEGEDGV
uniref:Uncharacterized protein n=1 Tax=Steinernema glaseri TaxID=37863 RepID=A0A1I7Z4B0_9BILA